MRLNGPKYKTSPKQLQSYLNSENICRTSNTEEGGEETVEIIGYIFTFKAYA